MHSLNPKLSLSNLFFYLSVKVRITQKSTVNEFINQYLLIIPTQL